MHGTLHLVFELHGQPYALPAKHVLKVVDLGPLVSLPRLPAAVRGISHHRGRVVTVVDLGLLLHPGAPPLPTRGRTVLMASSGRELGLLVGEVREILELEPEDGSPPSRDGTPVIRLHAHGGRALQVLDPPRVLQRIGKLVQPDYATVPRRPAGAVAGGLTNP